MKRGFFIGCAAEFWLNVLDGLDGVQFDYIVGLSDYLNRIQRPVGLLHNLQDAERGVLPPGVAPQDLPVADEAILSRFNAAEIAALNISSRKGSYIAPATNSKPSP